MKRHLAIQNEIPDVKPGMMAAVDHGTARRAQYDANEPILGKTGTCTDRATPTHLGWFGSFNEVGHNKLVVVVLLTGGKPVKEGKKVARKAAAIVRAETRAATTSATIAEENAKAAVNAEAKAEAKSKAKAESKEKAEAKAEAKAAPEAKAKGGKDKAPAKKKKAE